MTGTYSNEPIVLLTNQQIANGFMLLKYKTCVRIPCTDCPLRHDPFIERDFLMTDSPINFTKQDTEKPAVLIRRMACSEYITKQRFLLPEGFQERLKELMQNVSSDVLAEALMEALL